MARILVVDDSAVMRRNLISVLTKAGHEIVAQASDGGQAHSLYRTYLPDLVTMDITMPEVNGIEAVGRIRADFPDANIIMISALDQKQMVLEALKLGAKHYIIKPINPEKVISIINKVLGITPVQPVETEAKVVTNKLTPIPEPVEQEPDSPFVIQNLNSIFYIKLTRLLSIENIGSLLQAAQGLLYVQPLSVVIDFGVTETVAEEILNRVAEIIKLIQGANGKIKVIAKNEQFVNSVKEMNVEGLSELFAG